MDPRIEQALTDLQSKESQVRMSACERLRALAPLPDEALEAVFRIIVRSEWPSHAAFIFNALGPSAASFAGRLCAAYEAGDSRHRYAIADALASLGAGAAPVFPQVLAAIRGIDEHGNGPWRALLTTLRNIAPDSPERDPEVRTALVDLLQKVRHIDKIDDMARSVGHFGTFVMPAAIEAFPLYPDYYSLILGHLGAAAESAIPLIARHIMENPRTAEHGVSALGGIGLWREDVESALRVVLRVHDEWTVVNSAVGAAASLSPHSVSLLPELRARLRDQPHAPGYVAEALGWIGPPARTAVPDLSWALAQYGPYYEHLRECSAIALSRMGADARSAIPQLRVTAALENHRVATDAQRRSLRLLERFSGREAGHRRSPPVGTTEVGAPDPEEVLRLRTAMSSSLLDTRVQAAWGLYELFEGTPPFDRFPALAPELQSRRESEVLEDCWFDFGQLVGMGPCAALAALAYARAIERKGQWENLFFLLRVECALAFIQDRLVDWMQREAPDFRRRLLQALRLVGPEAHAAAPAVRPLLSDPDLRLDAARTLVELAPGADVAEEALSVLSDFTGDHPQRMRGVARAAECLGPLAAPRLPWLLGRFKRLDHGRGSSRESAIRAFGNMGEAGSLAVPLLVELMRDRGDAAEAMDSLVLIGRAAVPAMIEEIQRGSAKYGALVVLGRMAPEDEGVVNALHDALRAEDRWVRWAAVWCARGIGKFAVSRLPELKRLTEDPDAEIAALTREALEECGDAGRQ